MKITVGSTVLRASERHQTIDGIAHYTSGLLKALQCENLVVSEYDFASKDSFFRFKLNHLLSGVTGRPLSLKIPVEKYPDIFHATDHIIPKLENTPVVATIMDPIPLLHPEWVRGSQRKLKNWLFKKSANWADHIITISKFSAREITHAFDIDQDNITAVPLAVDEIYSQKLEPDSIHNVLRKYVLKPGFFLFIGTIQPRKNLDRLLDAFLALPASIQVANPLVIVGRQGWECFDTVQRIRLLEKDGTVIWLNGINEYEKRALLQSARALVFPSLYEGFGLPALEAFASGLPVIASNTTALREVAGSAALLIDPINTKEINAAMACLAVDETVSVRYRNKGLERAKLYSWEKTARQTIQVYQQLFSKKY